MDECDYYIIFNNLTNIDVGASIISRIAKPCSEKRYEEIVIPGRPGKLYIDKGYDDIELLPIEFNFLSLDPKEWDSRLRKVKKWISNIENNKLRFSDDLGVFYRVNKVVLDSPERIFKKLGKFNLTFTCEPFVYLEEGQAPRQLSNIIYNSFEKTQPTYIIKGEGLLKLKVNGNVIEANIGQNLIIDTKSGLCYRNDGSINNVAMKGFMEDLYLDEGENTFEWSNNFTIDIIPNWRCI